MGSVLYLADRESPSFRQGRLSVDVVCAGDSITGWNNIGGVECWPYQTRALKVDLCAILPVLQ